MVLAHSLRDCGTKEQLAVLVTLDSLQESTITELKVQIQHPRRERKRHSLTPYAESIWSDNTC